MFASAMHVLHVIHAGLQSGLDLGLELLPRGGRLAERLAEALLEATEVVRAALQEELDIVLPGLQGGLACRRTSSQALDAIVRTLLLFLHMPQRPADLSQLFLQALQLLGDHLGTASEDLLSEQLRQPPLAGRALRDQLVVVFPQPRDLRAQLLQSLVQAAHPRLALPPGLGGVLPGLGPGLRENLGPGLCQGLVDGPALRGEEGLDAAVLGLLAAPQPQSRFVQGRHLRLQIAHRALQLGALPLHGLAQQPPLRRLRALCARLRSP
mmetsp:Transcript_121041/g.302059  ORF Transcript_121041/g.302059 Transcript_121041/m.302059 type:complete len:267 (+) Transcript_121041:263-1063(+)